LLNKLYEVFICTCAAGNCSYRPMNKHEAKCTLQIVWHLSSCFVHYFIWKFETVFFCRSWDCS